MSLRCTELIILSVCLVAVKLQHPWIHSYQCYQSWNAKLLRLNANIRIELFFPSCFPPFLSVDFVDFIPPWDSCVKNGVTYKLWHTLLILYLHECKSTIAYALFAPYHFPVRTCYLPPTPPRLGCNVPRFTVDIWLKYLKKTGSEFEFNRLFTSSLYPLFDSTPSNLSWTSR